MEYSRKLEHCAKEKKKTAVNVHLELSWCAVEDEHEPEDLVEALDKDVEPHGLVDQRLCASVRCL